MSAQRLSEKKTRRLARQVDLPVTRAWTHGVHGVVAFVFPDEHNDGAHLHGVARNVGPDIEVSISYLGAAHYTSCRELFPDDPEWASS